MNVYLHFLLSLYFTSTSTDNNLDASVLCSVLILVFSSTLLSSHLVQLNQSLKTLQLANCDLNLSTLVALSTSLANNSSLTSLNLDRPILSSKQEENADHFSRVLGYHPTLQELSLRHGETKTRLSICH